MIAEALVLARKLLALLEQVVESNRELAAELRAYRERHRDG